MGRGSAAVVTGKSGPGRGRRALEYGLGGCCAALLAGLAGLTVVDVVGRYVFNAPLSGAFELTQLMLGALVFAALPLTTIAGEHVEVDMLYGLSPAPARRAMRLLGALVSAAALWVIAWRLAVHAQRLAVDGTMTNALSLPLAPLGWLAAGAAATSGCRSPSPWRRSARWALR